MILFYIYGVKKQKGFFYGKMYMKTVLWKEKHK